jgi:hypothetical protein
MDERSGELYDRICNGDWDAEKKLHPYAISLLLSFSSPQVYDLSIPCAYQINRLVQISLYNQNGEEIKPENVNSTSTGSNCDFEIVELEEFEQQFGKGDFSENMFLTMLSTRRQTSILEMYVSMHREHFRHEWFCGHGDWYEFRTGKRETFAKHVENELPKEHIENIKLIGNGFQDFIPRIHGGCMK